MHRLEKIVSRDLPVIISLRQEETTPVAIQYLIEDFRNALADESDRIRHDIMHAASDTVCQRKFRKFIRQHQYRLVVLDSTLVNYESEQSELTRILCRCMHRCLIELLSFLEEHFSKYMYWHTWVHKNFMFNVRKEVGERLKQTLEIVSDNGACEMLVSILNETFQRFLDPGATPHVTYARIRYLQRLQSGLIRLKSTTGNVPAGLSMGAVEECLFTLNFNSRRYFAYWSYILQADLSRKPTAFEKLTLLADAAKRIRQYAFINRASYNPDALPLPVMMTQWIREESDMLEKLFNLSVLSGDSRNAPANDLSLEKKTELGISVAVLAAAIRSLVMSKTLPDENLTGLARMLSRCFTTIRSGGSFSTETFRQSYYNISDSSRQTVINIFQHAIQWLKNHG